MRLMINEGKTKHMVIKKGNQLDQNRILKTENYCFEKVESFKHLGVDINSHDNHHKETKLWIKPDKRRILSNRKPSDPN